MGKEEGNGNPLEMYLREEMYPDLPEEVIHTLHRPQDGIANSAYLEDLPMFPNPFDPVTTLTQSTIRRRSAPSPTISARRR